jgi:hypothetical protein
MSDNEKLRELEAWFASDDDITPEQWAVRGRMLTDMAERLAKSLRRRYWVLTAFAFIIAAGAATQAEWPNWLQGGLIGVALLLASWAGRADAEANHMTTHAEQMHRLIEREADRA